jgi:hypothetical protein
MLAGVPEILEVERYRRAAEPLTGRTIRAVEAPDDWYLKRGLTAPELVAVIFGSNWASMTLPLQIFAVGMLFRTSYKVCDSVARAKSSGLTA